MDVQGFSDNEVGFKRAELQFLNPRAQVVLVGLEPACTWFYLIEHKIDIPEQNASKFGFAVTGF